MDTSESRGSGWVTYSGLVLSIGGLFAIIEGLTAVYKSTFFAPNAVFVFSDLNTWGWIIFAAGVLGLVSGIAVFSGREWARWTGALLAAVGALGQLLFAQAYPIWSLMIMSVYFLALYGLVAYGGRQSAASARSSYDEGSGETSRASSPAAVSGLKDQTRRAA
jgi:hypothetical protein